MILQALHKLYDRLSQDPDYGIAQPGYSVQKIAFAVVLTPEGRLHSIADERVVDPPPPGQKSKSTPKPRLCVVPGQAKPSGSGINPCLFWDNTDYLLGFDPKNEKPDRTAKAFQALKQRHLDKEREINDPAFAVVCRFLETWSPDEAINQPLLAEMTTGFGVFRMQGESEYLHERSRIRDWWRAQQGGSTKESGPVGMCLISGQTEVPLARLHEPKIKGVQGAQGAGAPLVSFNCDVFTSYGKEQSYNAPVSEEATFRYCTVLNELLGGPQKNRHRIRLADDTVIFWTGKKTRSEDVMATLFSGGGEEGEKEGQDNATLGNLQLFLQALREGAGSLSILGDNPETPFYILGLSPNSGRVSVRFWHSDTLGGFVERLRSHFQALAIVRPPGGKEFPPVWMLLQEAVRDGKDVPPLLGGALMRAILTGGRYPDALASAVIRRIRADRDDKQHQNRQINYRRAAILKAWLIRSPRWQGDIPVSLNTTRPEPAYRLGRLFATLEKTQQEALGDNLNATIRDRYYGAISSTPGSVVPRLLRTYQHHLSNLSFGAKVNREKLVQEIMGGLATIPRTLSLEEQGLFAIGYYHQRQDFFTRKGDDMIAPDNH